MGKREHIPLWEWKRPDGGSASLPESQGQECGFADLDSVGSNMEAGTAGISVGCRQTPFSKTPCNGARAPFWCVWVRVSSYRVLQPALGMPTVQEADDWPGLCPRAVGFSQDSPEVRFGTLLLVCSLKSGSWLSREKPFKNSFSA